MLRRKTKLLAITREGATSNQWNFRLILYNYHLRAYASEIRVDVVFVAVRRRAVAR